MVQFHPFRGRLCLLSRCQRTLRHISRWTPSLTLLMYSKKTISRKHDLHPVTEILPEGSMYTWYFSISISTCCRDKLVRENIPFYNADTSSVLCVEYARQKDTYLRYKMLPGTWCFEFCQKLKQPLSLMACILPLIRSKSCCHRWQMSSFPRTIDTILAPYDGADVISDRCSRANCPTTLVLA